MFGALAARGIAPDLINTSEVRINVTLSLARCREAKECLAHAFRQPTNPEARALSLREMVTA
jgi:hypothetical protein